MDLNQSDFAGKWLLLFLVISASIAQKVDFPPRGSGVVSSEGFFLNGSSYAVLPEGLNLEPGSLVGFSFRTCMPGELLKQTGDGFDEFRLLLDDNGRLILNLVSGEVRSEAIVEAGLLDSRWHTVFLAVNAETNDLTVNVSNGGGSAVLRGSSVRSLNLSAASPVLRVGAGMVACIREGPGIEFSRSNAISSNNVAWLSPGQTCLLPATCSGKILI